MNKNEVIKFWDAWQENVLNDIIKILKGENKMTQEEAYLEYQKNCGFEIGGRVKIIAKAKDYQGGWDNTWMDEKNKYIDKIGTIEYIGKRGIIIDFDDGKLDCSYPAFILEKVKNEKMITINGKEYSEDTIQKALEYYIAVNHINDI